MVQRLDAEGLLKYEKYRGLVLTEAGETVARSITRRHELLTDFFRLLGLDERVINHDVEGMEHHISPSTLRAIEALTEQLRRRPALTRASRVGPCLTNRKINNLTRPAMNCQRDRPTTDAAVLD